MTTFDYFEAWLRRQNFAESTMRRTLRDAAQIERWAIHDRELPPRLLPTAQLLLRAARERNETEQLLAELGPRFATLVSEAGEAAFAAWGKRKSRPHSYTDEEWARLAAALERASAPEARVIEVMAATGLRVGDVLRLEREAFFAGLRTGRFELEQKGRAGGDLKRRTIALDGARDVWYRLGRQWLGGATIAAWLAPDSTRDAAYDTAYGRCRSFLLDLGRVLGLGGHVHLHRLRRTVATQVYRLTEGDIHAVSQVLGHTSLSSTERYLDEEQPDRVADLQRRIRERYRQGPQIA